MRKLFYTLLFLFATGQTIIAQTTIVNPAGDGGFETGDGSFTANGWTVVNGTATNQWYTGTVPTGFTNRSAYISNNTGTAWTYTNTTATVVHFYRDVTIPAGETNVTLSFDWNARGETGFWDALLVGFSSTSVTPAASTTSIGTGLPDDIVNVGQFWTNAASATQNAVINIPAGALGNCSAPVTVRLVFTWKNDGSGGTSPPAGIDNISLVSQTAAPVVPGRIPFIGGTFTINPSSPNTGTNFTTFTEAVTELNLLNSGCNVLTGGITFNVAAGAVFTEDVPAILTSGTVSTPIVFQKNGGGANPVVTPANPGTIASSTTLGSNGDAILTITGGDYITFDGIDVATNPAFTGTGRYEYGYLLRKANPVNASKNVTIKNASITLDKAIYSFGIYVSNLDAAGAAVTASLGGQSENIKIFSNTITNSYGGINVTGSVATLDQNIEIGVEGGNAITDFGGGGSTAYGIYTIYQDGLKVANNTIASATSGHTTTLYGILASTALNANTSIYSNTITVTGKGTTAIIYGISNTSGGTGTSNTVNIYNNTITGVTYTTATSGSAYMIHNSATAYNLNIYGNNINNNSSSPTTTGTFYGIFQDGAVVNSVKIYNDTIINSTRTTGTTGVAYGIYNNTNATTGDAEIYNNTISEFKVARTTGNTIGIHHAAGQSSKIYGNTLTGVVNTAATTTGAAYGISVAAGTDNKVYNNFVSDIASVNTGANTDAVRGISITATTANSTNLVAHNTIYLTAQPGGSVNYGTAGIYQTGSATATTAALTLQNNIIVNNSTYFGTGITAAFRRSLASLSNYAEASNNNLFYAGTPGSSNVIYYDGTNSDQTLNDFKARVSLRETASITELPPFVNVASTPYDLHINITIVTQTESGGVAVAGVTTDIDGDSRHATTPDIGADEFAGIGADLTGPIINYTELPVTTICLSGPTITATITDASGINTTAGTKPRLWFKKAGESDVLPANNNSTSNGWKWVEATNSGSPFTFTFDFSLLTAPVVAGDSISYFIVAQDLAAIPNIGVSVATFGVTPSSVALSGAAFPVSGNINGFLILNQPNPILIKADRTELCVSGSVTLNVDGVDVTGGEFQWQSSPAGANTWTDIPTGTTMPYTTDVFSANTDFRLQVKCGGTPIASSPSSVVSVTVNNPQVLTTIPASRCGNGTVTLVATGSAGTTLRWYDAPTGGDALETGPSFTTPVIGATTTYYVSAGEGVSSSNVGPLSPAIGTQSASNIAIGTQGGFFDVLAPSAKILSVDVYPTAAIGSSFTIQIRNSSGTTIYTSSTFVTTVTGGATPQTVTLDAVIPQGTGYRIGQGTAINLMRNTTGAVYPYTIPGIISLTGNSFDPVYYYFFYNWQVETGCESARVPVIATVNTPPAINATAADPTICAGESTQLNVTSANAGYTYVWTPGNIPGASPLVSPAVSTLYTVTATDNSGGPNDGCANISTVNVTVNPVPSALTVTPSSSTFCSGASAQLLSATGGEESRQFDFGIQAAQNTASTTAPGYPAPYTVYYGGQRMQMLITAAELTTAGFSAGSPITSLEFPVVSLGSNWGGTLTACQNFQVSVGHTALTSISSFQTGLTQVIAPGSFTPTVGYNNTHTFSSPFVWNGTSNLIIETTFSNSITGGTNDLVTQYNSPTPFQSTIVYRVDGIAAATVATTTTVSFSYSARPDFKLNSFQQGNITWSPTTNLFTDAAASIPYTGGNAASVYVLPLSSQNYTITATNGANCTTSTSASVAIVPPPSATIAYTGSPYCSNAGTAAVTLTGSAGGTYTSTAGLSINSTTGAVDLAASTVGTYTVTYTIAAANACPQFQTTGSITIEAAPAATIAYTGSPYCGGGGTATVTLTGTTGGTFTSTAGLAINSSTGAIDLASSTVGTYTVTYTVAAGTCTQYQVTAPVTITTSPSATISYAGSPYCSNGTTAAVTHTGSSGGVYSSTTGLSINSTTGTVDISTSTPGTYTVTYAIAAGNGCSAFQTTTSITITALPSATISYSGSPYCSNAGTATVTTTGTTGGTYTSTAGLSINASTGAVNLGASTAGTYTVTYTIAAGSGCPQIQTTTSITVTAAPNATISYSGSPYCSSAGTATVSRTGTAGGTYSSIAGLSIDASTGAVNIGASTVGIYTVTYTVAAANGCAQFQATTSITIIPTPSATISYAGSPYCVSGGTATVTHTGTTGGTYTSAPGLSINASTGDVNLSASTPGSYTVTYTVTAGGCPQFQTTASITITLAPAATISYAGSPYCSNAGAATVTRTGTAGGTYSSTAGLSINAATGAVNLGASTPGTYTVTYTVAAGSGCPELQATTSITVTGAPAATISYAGSPYCSSAGTANVTLTGSTGGTYTSTAGLSINATTGAVNIAASTAGTYTVTYTIAAANGCAQMQTTTSLTITTAPAATISYAGSPFCISGGTINVTRTGTAGGTYSSTAGLSINASTGAVTLSTSTAGTYTVTYTVAAAGGCAQLQATTTITIAGAGTWLGLISSDWTVPGNWCGGLPTSATDITIPSTAPNMPNLSAANGTGRNITINNGASVTIGAGGTLDVYGNISGAGTFTSTAGNINFRGITAQTVPSFSAVNVTMNGSGGVTPGGNVTITGALLLLNGNITIGNNNLTLSSTSTGSAASHIVTNGTGNVIVANLAASQTRIIPVGNDATSYNPVTLAANAGHTTDNLTVRVIQGVYENGISGTTFTTHVANRMWLINESTPGGSNVNVTLQWSGSQELTSFDRTNCYVMQHNGTTWVQGTGAAATGTDPYSQTKQNVTSFSSFAVQTQPIPRPVTGIYPNPAKTFLNVVLEAQADQPFTLKIFDAGGRMVLQKVVTLRAGLNQVTLDVFHLSPGIHILRVSSLLNDKFLVAQFFKE